MQEQNKDFKERFISIKIVIKNDKLKAAQVPRG
jgi:hypothetical protein